MSDTPAVVRETTVPRREVEAWFVRAALDAGQQR